MRIGSRSGLTLGQFLKVIGGYLKTKRAFDVTLSKFQARLLPTASLASLSKFHLLKLPTPAGARPAVAVRAVWSV